ncbi:DUF928 domain-containing protein [Phormidesmis sp. 146-35]
MTLINRFLNKSINLKFIIGCMLSLGLVVTSSTEAAYVPGAQKPAPKGRRSDAGTTRGCVGGELPLTVLASRTYIGRTTSGHPTFAWFVPPDSVAKPMKFVIYEWVPNGKPKAIRQLSLQSSPGIMKLSPFSKNEPGLQPGKDYFWQVVIQCDPDNPSGDLVSGTSIEVVAMSTSVQNKLSKAVNSAERANIYAEEGLWYDALSEALKQAQASKLGTLGATLLNDLAQSEVSKTMPESSSPEGNTIAKQSVTLKQIAGSAR